MNESDARSAILVRAYETPPPKQMYGAWTGDDRAWLATSDVRVTTMSSPINASIGGSSGSSALLQAINYAQAHDVVIIASGGNDGDGSYSK